MSIIDAIKNSVLEQFTGSVTIPAILLSVLVAFAISAFIVVIYRKTFANIVYNRGICLCIIMLSLVTAMIIRTINSNLSLSLGMVGALSIVRFRTAVKDPVDTSFLFWAITAGIMSGAGLYVVAIVASAAIGLLYYLVYLFGAKAKSQYLLVVNFDNSVESKVAEKLKTIAKKKLRSKSANNKGTIELTYEVEISKKLETLITEISQIEGVKNVNLITYQNEFGV